MLSIRANRRFRRKGTLRGVFFYIFALILAYVKKKQYLCAIFRAKG